MKRQGDSLPWSGTRAPARRISASCAFDGPGAVMARAGQDRRLSSTSSAVGPIRFSFSVSMRTPNLPRMLVIRRMIHDPGREASGHLLIFRLHAIEGNNVAGQAILQQ